MVEERPDHFRRRFSGQRGKHSAHLLAVGSGSLGDELSLPSGEVVIDGAAGATGNPFLTSIVGGTVHILDSEAVFAGGTNRPLLLIELKLPAVALADSESQAAFIENATQVAELLTSEGHRREDIWINILHARDGAWGLGGKAYSNDALLAAAGAEAAGATGQH